MQVMASALLEHPTGRQYDCVCLKYGFGRTHKVSHTAWNQHLANAGSEDERHRIRMARLLGEQMTSLPPPTKYSSPPDRDYSVPPGVRRAEARRGLAKQAREARDPSEHVGRRKRARVKQPGSPEPFNLVNKVSVLGVCLLTMILSYPQTGETAALSQSQPARLDEVFFHLNLYLRVSDRFDRGQPDSRAFSSTRFARCVGTSAPAFSAPLSTR